MNIVDLGNMSRTDQKTASNCPGGQSTPDPDLAMQEEKPPASFLNTMGSIAPPIGLLYGVAHLLQQARRGPKRISLCLGHRRHERIFNTVGSDDSR